MSATPAKVQDVKVAFPKRRQISIRRNEPELWPFEAALVVGFAVAVLGLTALTLVAWLLLHRPSPPHPGTISLHDAVSVIQLVFASVAGSGALVALVVAYRKQKIAEADSAHDRTRVFNERFATIATQLGDESPAVRLAAVHAMASLADDWDSNRQTCIDVLCAYLRMPYEPDPGENASTSERLTFQSNREVRHTIIRVITAHLKDGAPVSWQGRNFDFTGVAFDGGDFTHAKFTGGTVNFTHARFASGTVNFTGAKFTDGTVITFTNAEFTGGTVHFAAAEFGGGTVNILTAKFSGGTVNFTGAKFTDGTVIFLGAKFAGSTVNFAGSEFTGGTVYFAAAEFGGGTVHFTNAKFASGTVSFINAAFTDGTVIFRASEFTGGTVNFAGSEFTDGAIDFSGVSAWSHPPIFDDPVPTQVKLPAGPDPANSED